MFSAKVIRSSLINCHRTIVRGIATSKMVQIQVSGMDYTQNTFSTKPQSHYITRKHQNIAVISPFRIDNSQVGDNIPSSDLFEESPANKVNLADLCKGKKVVLFAVPGAFTPGCSKVSMSMYSLRNRF